MSRSNTETMRRLRVGNLRTLLRARCGHTLPDDDAGREYLYELLLPISLGPEPNAKMEYAMEVWAPWINVEERFHLVAQIERTAAHVRKVKATTLGERLRVTSKERERLRLWTIAPCDMTAKELKDQRKAKDRIRKAHRRHNAGSKPQERSLSRLKPWVGASISRASWYRNKRETTSSAVKLLNNRGQTCLTEQAARPIGSAERGKGGKAEITSGTQSKRKVTEKQHEPSALSVLVSTADKTVSQANLSQLNGNGGGGLRVRVWIREIRHPAIRSGPDFKIAVRTA